MRDHGTLSSIVPSAMTNADWLGNGARIQPDASQVVPSAGFWRWKGRKLPIQRCVFADGSAPVMAPGTALTVRIRLPPPPEHTLYVCQSGTTRERLLPRYR